MMYITIKAKIETKCFDHVRNKPNMKEIFVKEVGRVFGLTPDKAKRSINMKVTWEEEKKDELL